MKQAGIASGSGVAHGVWEAVVFDVDVVAFVDDAVDALAVGGPEVVVVGLFGVEADRVEKFKGEGAEEDVDVGEVFGAIV